MAWLISLPVLLVILNVIQFSISDKLFSIRKSFARQNSTFFEENFKEVPVSRLKSRGKKKNLILIISESLETTYMREDLFGENLIPELTKLQSDNLSFQHRLQVYGTGWTIAALTSVFYGIPQIPLYSYKLKNHALTNAYFDIPSIYDYLHANGYKCSYMQGGYIEFAGKKNLFLNKKFIELEHFGTLSKTPLYEQNTSPYEWGVNDEVLFHYAKKKTLEIASAGQPFFLSMLTLDTHFPHGYLPPHQSVEKDYFRQVLRMQDKMIYDYIEFLKKQPFYNDTVVAVIGDHLTMQNDLGDILEKCEIVDPSSAESGDGKRTAYNVFLNVSLPEGQHPRSMYFSTFDFMPTLLHAVGGSWGGDQLHFGVSLLGTTDTLLEKYGPVYYREEMLKNHPFYISLLKNISR